MTFLEELNEYAIHLKKSEIHGYTRVKQAVSHITTLEATIESLKHDIERHIAIASELAEAQRWVPFTERMPGDKKDTSYIVATSWGVMVDTWEWEYQQFEQTQYTGTHWKPLTPPIEDSDK